MDVVEEAADVAFSLWNFSVLEEVLLKWCMVIVSSTATVVVVVVMVVRAVVSVAEVMVEVVLEVTERGFWVVLGFLPGEGAHTYMACGEYGLCWMRWWWW